MRITLILLTTVALLTNCNDKPQKYTAPEMEPQVVSLLGTTYFEPLRSEETQKLLDKNLADAKAQFEKEPSEINYIWYGRRTAYLTRYYKSIEIYTEGLEKYPESYKLLRHRGHRYISVRDFDKAIADLGKAAELMPKDTLEIEPDGIPNKINQPLSSTQFNVWYHLALAHYLKGDFDKANEIYAKCMQTSVNNDLVCATADWQYMTLKRLGQDNAADSVLQMVSKEMNVIENDSYHKRLMMYKGEIPADSLLSVSNDNPDQDLALATQGYGVGNWYLYNGDTTKAVEIYEKVIAGKHWSAFGFIAAEADLYHLE